MIRALFISHNSSLYGAQLSLLGLLSHLDRKDVDVMLVAPHEGPLNLAIADLGIPVIIRRSVHWIASDDNARRLSRLGYSRYFLAGLKGRIWALAHLIEKHQIDVVYTNTVVSIEGALAARLTRRPHIWHLREQVAGNSQLKSAVPAVLIPHIVGRLSDRVIVNSRYLGEVYAHGRAQKKLDVIYNGVDPAQFALDRNFMGQTLRAELGLEDGAQLVVLIGAVIPRKGPMLIAQAAARIIQSIPNATFLIVGEGEIDYIDKIKAFCIAKCIQKQVLFLGWRPDIPRILAAANILVVAADEEPFGRTVIEAMASGTPVVSTRCGGPEEIVIDKQTGLLVPRNDIDALVKAIEYILCNSTVADQLAAAALQRLHKTFTLKAHALKVQSLISDVVQKYQYLHSRA